MEMYANKRIAGMKKNNAEVAKLISHKVQFKIKSAQRVKMIV